MTAEALKGDRERCLNAGMDDYVSKPIDPKELYRAVEGLAAVRRLREPNLLIKPSTPNLSPPPPIDLTLMEKQIPGGAEGIRELSDIFCLQAPRWMGEMRTAIQSRDAKLLRRIAHTIKGSSAYFGASALIQAALVLEKCGHDANFENVEPAMQDLDIELSRVLTALAAHPTTSLDQ